MELITIEINSLGPTETAYKAADIVIETIRQAGIDPAVAAGIPLVQQMTIDWRDGKITREQFMSNLQKIAILNPSLLLKPSR